MENENDIYLADWLADTITDEQLQQLVSEEDFLAYQKIRMTLHNLGVSEPDMERDFVAIKKRIENKKTDKKSAKRTRRIIPLWTYPIAASLLLFLGWYQVYFSSNVITTNFGVTRVLNLSDNSTVTLNSKSKVSYPNLFQYNRTIQLEGEAFFQVQKGKQFTVETALGSIQVLGTQFNVTAFSDYFEVVCYEGKVRVQSKNQSVILTKGESVRLYGQKFENWADTFPVKPDWISGESTFKNVPVKYVIEKFENQYDVKIKFPKNLENSKFTGSFTNSNIETALKTICIPLNLKFSNTNSKTIQISE